MKIKVIRMWSGEDVVADLIEEKDDSVVICNPIVAVPAGNGQMGFAPWSPLLKGKNEELEVTKKYIVYMADTQTEIEEVIWQSLAKNSWLIFPQDNYFFLSKKNLQKDFQEKYSLDELVIEKLPPHLW